MFTTEWSLFITLAGFRFASSTVVVAVVVVVADATDSRDCFVGDCELLVRGDIIEDDCRLIMRVDIIEDDVPIATEWGGGGFCFNLSRFLCKICRLTVDTCSLFIHRAICNAADVLFQGATKRNFPASASLPSRSVVSIDCAIFLVLGGSFFCELISTVRIKVSSLYEINKYEWKDNKQEILVLVMCLIV